MTPSPPSTYTPPAIGLSGLVIPGFSAILNNLIALYKNLYGANIYLGDDSSDYQWLSVLALQAFDFDQAIQGVYLSFNPQTAIGASLDLLGVLIGTPRLGTSFSTVALTLSGIPGAVITNGSLAQDVNGNYWVIPGNVTIGGGGTAVVTAVAQLPGPVTVQPAQVTIIATPTAGWTSVTNAGPSTVGQSVEPDSHYRARLLISQAKPSISIAAGTEAAALAVGGVTRAVVYENPLGYTTSFGTCDTSATAVTLDTGYAFDSSMAGQTIHIAGSDYTIGSVGSGTTLTLTGSAGAQTGVPFYIGTINGIVSNSLLGPAHSITTVVEGGLASAIAQAIYSNHNPGCDINGTTTVLVADQNNGTVELPVSFDILGYTIIYVALAVQEFVGYTSATTNAIIIAVVNYLNNLGIGQTVVWSQVIAAATSVSPNPEVPLFSIHSATLGQQSASTTATLNTTTTIVVASATGIANGQTVVGNGIPANTTVTGVSGMNVSINNAATISATGVAVSFFTTGSVDIPITYNKAPGGDTVNTIVNIVS